MLVSLVNSIAPRSLPPLFIVEPDLDDEVLDEPFGFEIALGLMKAGYKVRRAGWAEFCFIRMSDREILNNDDAPWQPMSIDYWHACLTAEDWEVYDDADELPFLDAD